MKRVLLTVCLALAVMTATLGIAAKAGAVANPVPAPQTAVSTVTHATTAAQQAVGRAVSGDPAKSPAVTTSSTGDVTAASPDGTTLGIKLPVVPVNQSTVNGDSVLSSTDQATAVVSPTVGGVQVAQDILGPSAPTTYSYKLELPPGYYPVMQTTGIDAGTIALTSATGATALNSTNTIGFIEPAWAVDANGKSVPTSYTVSGVTVTQTVNFTSSTAFPVVADPHVTFGWVIYVHWYHSEVTGVLWLAFLAGIGAAASFACTAISLGFLVPVCMFLFGAATAWVISLFEGAYARGGGLVWEFTYTGTPLGYIFVGDNWS